MPIYGKTFTNLLQNRTARALETWYAALGTQVLPTSFKWRCLDHSPFYGKVKFTPLCIWARPWENVYYAICEQQRRRSACASPQSDQRLCCLLPRQNDTSSLYIWNFKILAGRCSWAGQFVSCLIRDSWRHIFSWRGSFIRERFFRNYWRLRDILTQHAYIYYSFPWR